MKRARVLVSGAGLAGLTLAIELKRQGFEPLVIEREAAPRTDGYMMELSGAGWEIASRLNADDDLRAINYPIDTFDFVDDAGKSWLEVPLARVRRALGGNYALLRRSDLDRVLTARARECGVEIRYATSLHALSERSDRVHATFVGGKTDDFALVFGADGAHSRVRALMFGLERRFARFLRLHVAAFQTTQNGYAFGEACKLYEEANRNMILYPLGGGRMDVICVFRHDDMDAPQSLASLRAQYRGAGWVAEEVLRDHAEDATYLDSAAQIVMSEWHRGRVALVGDACGCLTPVGGQGAQLAMAGGYVLARELARHADHNDAFAAYQAALKPQVDRKQRNAARLAKVFLPTQHSQLWLRRSMLSLLFSPVGLNFARRWLDTKDLLAA